MKQNAVDRALANIDAEIASLQQARVRIIDALAEPADESPAADKPKRGRPKRKGMPKGGADADVSL